MMVDNLEIDRFTEREGNQPHSCIIFEGELSDESKKISPDKIVMLQGNNERKNELQKRITYLNEKNFRLQIGKMQKDVETIYSSDVLKCAISYILKHIEKNKNGKVIIQLWPALAQKLSQHETGEILDYNEESLKIQDIINNFGEEGKFIEIQNVAENYGDVFEALKSGKDGIIPSTEPQLENLQFPLKSPLNIIKFLAYNANKDKKIMSLFYGTKPEGYKNQDKQNGLYAGDSDADYYSIVEVGIRLYEILQGIYIQGGIDRQKVYDRIIGLILFGEDKISTEGKKLKISDYPPLEKLNQWITKNFEKIRMVQLYVNLSSLDREIEKMEKKYEIDKREKEIRRMEHENIELKKQLSNNEHEIEKLIQERKQYEKGLDKNEKYKIKPFLKKIGLSLAIALSVGGTAYGIYKYNKSQQIKNAFCDWNMGKKNTNIPDELINDFRGSFDLYGFKIDDRKKVEELFEFYIESNPNIVKDWSKKTKSTQSIIRDFWKIYGGYLIKEYNLSFKPYDLIKKYNSDIENTISCNPTKMPKEIMAETDWKIYCIGNHGNSTSHSSLYYILKVVINDGGHKKHLLLASRTFAGPYTLYNGFEVISRKNDFHSFMIDNLEIFDSLSVNDTKHQVEQGNLVFNDIGKRRNYSLGYYKRPVSIYYNDKVSTKNVKVKPFEQETLKFKGDLTSKGIKVRDTLIGKKRYYLVRVAVGGKEYLLSGTGNKLDVHIQLSTDVLKEIDKKYLSLQEQSAYDNSINAGLRILGNYRPNIDGKAIFQLDIFKENYYYSNKVINVGSSDEIYIDGESFYVQSINCGREGNLLFAAKGSRKGRYTIENGKIVAEYLKKFKDLQKKDI